MFILFISVGDFISVSGPEGNFKVSKLQDVEDLFLLAAGTGFTPMVTILNYALSHMSSLRYVPLFLVTVIWEVLSAGLRALLVLPDWSSALLPSKRQAPPQF